MLAMFFLRLEGEYRALEHGLTFMAASALLGLYMVQIFYQQIVILQIKYISLHQLISIWKILLILFRPGGQRLKINQLQDFLAEIGSDLDIQAIAQQYLCMAQRLQILNEKISGIPKYVESSFDYLKLGQLFSPEEEEIRLKVRKWVEKEIVPTIHPYVEQAKFPQYLIPKFKQIEILDYFLKAPYGKGMSSRFLGCLVAEIARGDPGVCTLLVVQWGLVAFTIEALGSPEQKACYLPKLKSFEFIGGWGLTQQHIGSDASNLQTSVSKTTNGNYLLNGTKRWIGNGNRDLLVIWARNTENKKVEGYLVENKKAKGLTSQVIKNKLPMRVVQNCHITLKDVQVTPQQKLPLATDFNKGTNVVLKHSRLFVCWVAVGIALGVYDNAIKYISHRKQFGTSISGFQLVQEKIVKVMANTQAIFLLTNRISELADKGKATIGQIAMTKAYVTDRARDIARWGREIYGGNGIIHSNYAMKALADVQAIYTYEGTYDINTLVAGRELTGLAAFKK